MMWVQRDGQNKTSAVKATTVCFRKTDMLIMSTIQYNVGLLKDVCKNVGMTSKLVYSISGRLRKISWER